VNIFKYIFIFTLSFTYFLVTYTSKSQKKEPVEKLNILSDSTLIPLEIKQEIIRHTDPFTEENLKLTSKEKRNLILFKPIQYSIKEVTQQYIIDGNYEIPSHELEQLQPEANTEQEKEKREDIYKTTFISNINLLFNSENFFKLICNPLDLKIIYLDEEFEEEADKEIFDTEKIERINEAKTKAKNALSYTYTVNSIKTFPRNTNWRSSQIEELKKNYNIIIQEPEFIGNKFTFQNNYSVAKISITHKDSIIMTFIICSGLIQSSDEQLSSLFSYLKSQDGKVKVILTDPWQANYNNEKFNAVFKTLVQNSNAQDNKINITDCYNTPLLSVACNKGQENLVLSLLQANAWWNTDHLGNTPLHYAETDDIVTLLFKNDYAYSMLNARNIEDETPLFCASKKDNFIIANLLLEHKADPNISDKRGVTPLVFACFRNNSKLIKILLEHNANPNVIAKNGVTLITYVIRHQNWDIAQLLLDYGQKPNALLFRNQTLLIRACDMQSVPFTKLLLTHNAQVNLKDDHGNTALHYACMHNNKELVALLLEKDADPKIQDNRGITPLMIAQENKNQAIIDLLNTYRK
jgi:ankyrin repeat protein